MDTKTEKDILRADVAKALEVLRGGGVILYPTDTVWGIGCDATNTDAVNRIYGIKRRDDHKALITLVSDLAMLERTVDGIPDIAYDLIEVADRPLTIVYDGARNVSGRLTGKDGTIGVRVVRDNLAARLCRELRRPIVSTSANVSGQPTPSTFDGISQEILDAVDYVCMTGRKDDNRNARPSTVMRLCADSSFTILRH